MIAKQDKMIMIINNSPVTSGIDILNMHGEI